MTLPRFGITGPAMLAILAALDKHQDELPRVASVCQRNDGTTSHVRFEPSRVVGWVQWHVQSTGAGAGGASYDPANYVTSEEVDCRSTRIQDKSVSRNGSDHYYAWVIPIIEDGAGSRYKMDGESGRPDYAVFLDLGT